MRYIGLMIVFLLLLLPFSPSIADWMVGKLFANVNEPGGERSEPPQMSFPIPYSSADIQVHGGRGMKLSCSIPSSLDYIVFRDDKDADEAISLQMRQVCITHDYCYRHGAATYGYSQEDCDYQLLEGALRLCYYIAIQKREENTEEIGGVENCHTRAKKVLLGVRLGGGSSFKRVNVEDNYPDEQNFKQKAFDSSTYFEYEFYPSRSQSFKVYRIADIPVECASAENSKGLYEFRIKPAGLKLTIWNVVSDGYQKCWQLDIPSNPNYLTYAPFVVARNAVAEENEDWLVWWQRYDMDTTRGRFVSIAPSRASLKDWQKLFPGATETFRVHNSRSNPELIQNVNNNTPDAFIAETGKANSVENNFSELYPAVGFATNRLNLFALRTHSCKEGQNTLCYNHFELIPDAELDMESVREWQRHEPLKVRDSQNKEGTGPDFRRYRNFAIPPIVIRGPDNKPSLTWIRRGSIEKNKERTGADYNERGLLRRQVCRQSQTECIKKSKESLASKSLGTVSLEEFTEQDEPILVINRKSEQPILMGIRTSRRIESWPFNYDWQLFSFDNREKTSLRYWKLPKFKIVEDVLSNTDTDSSPKPDEVVLPEQIEGNCGDTLTTEWLIRSPQLYTAKDGVGHMLFSKVKVEEKNIYIEFLRGTINSNGKCELTEASDQINISDDFGDEMDEILKNLRKSPLIIMENEHDQNFLDMFIINSTNMQKSIIKREFVSLMH